MIENFDVKNTASRTMGIGYFPEVKRPGRGADHPTDLELNLKKKYSYSFTSHRDLHT